MAINKKIFGLIGAGSLAYFLFKKGSGPDITETEKPKKTPQSKPQTTKPIDKKIDRAIPLYEQWKNTYGGPLDWYKQVYNAGVRNPKIANVLVCLRYYKTAGYDPKKLVQKLDDQTRTNYVKWAARTALQEKVKYATIPQLYFKAFNQDVIKQYNPVWYPNYPIIQPFVGLEKF